MAEVGRVTRGRLRGRLPDPSEHQTRSAGSRGEDTGGRGQTLDVEARDSWPGAQPGGRGRRMRSRPHRSTPTAAGRTAGASRAAAGARSGGRDHRAVGGRRRGRRGRSLSQPKIFGGGGRLRVIILKVGMLRKLLVNLFQVERRGERAGGLGPGSVGRAARCRGPRVFPGRQLRSHVFRGLVGKIDPLDFCVNSSRLGGHHGAKNAVQVIDGRKFFVTFELCCCLVPSCGQSSLFYTWH